MNHCESWSPHPKLSAVYAVVYCAYLHMEMLLFHFQKLRFQFDVNKSPTEVQNYYCLFVGNQSTANAKAFFFRTLNIILGDPLVWRTRINHH